MIDIPKLKRIVEAAEGPTRIKTLVAEPKCFEDLLYTRKGRPISAEDMHIRDTAFAQEFNPTLVLVLLAALEEAKWVIERYDEELPVRMDAWLTKYFASKAE